MSAFAFVAGVRIHGVDVDGDTRCAHYHSSVDIVAIRFFCCRQWYPCLHCHDTLTGHPIRPWPANAALMPAALCGGCGEQMSIAQYRAVDRCPRCAAMFNEGCALHHSVYFG